jgi:hypothetical protein
VTIFPFTFSFLLVVQNCPRIAARRRRWRLDGALQVSRFHLPTPRFACYAFVPTSLVSVVTLATRGHSLSHFTQPIIFLSSTADFCPVSPVHCAYMHKPSFPLFFFPLANDIQKFAVHTPNLWTNSFKTFFCGVVPLKFFFIVTSIAHPPLLALRPRTRCRAHTSCAAAAPFFSF